MGLGGFSGVHDTGKNHAAFHLWQEFQQNAAIVVNATWKRASSENGVAAHTIDHFFDKVVFHFRTYN